VAGPEVRELRDAIRSDDELGRDERSSRAAKKALRKRERGLAGHARVSNFMPPDGLNEISVNRMGFALDAELADIGVRNAAALGRSFWGWYVLSASDIEAAGCTVKASPVAGNP